MRPVRNLRTEVGLLILTHGHDRQDWSQADADVN
jgi:hypothetical protein